MTTTPPDPSQPTPDHRIRLRRPWSRTVAPEMVSSRIDVPELDTGSDQDASAISWIEYRRVFQCPPAVLQSEVRIRVERWTGDLIQISLNESPLEVIAAEPSDGQSWLVSDQLKRTNELVLRIRPNPTACLDGEVNLLVREA